MTYLALARKWRPKTFADVAGQGHVVRALENALNSGRVHHAFLFTGTRGVGKTTIARILVKALNCEQGVSGKPCGQCGSCKAVEEGRFIDFVELDAASHTGIDNAREMLENAQYRPAEGRYKVYLIDEVHMLSKPAFNALLKTLEEPPPHVKFLLATTDPQKIPVTVLSRCLQFNLKRLGEATIAERLTAICAAEKLEAEPGAIQRLARAGEGSMRDALSLLDQALAFGNGAVRDREVADMLGSLDRTRLLAILGTLVRGDASALMAELRALGEMAPDYDDVLAGLASLLQKMAVIQVAGSDALEGEEDLAELTRMAGGLDPGAVQLMYQIAVMGRRDLPLAPDPQAGFEMALLRVLAFEPQVEERPVAGLSAGNAASTAPPPRVAVAPPSQADQDGPIGDWPAFMATLRLDGAARQLAANCALTGQLPGELHLSLEARNRHLLTDSLKGRLTAAVAERLGGAPTLSFAIQDEAPDTAAGRQARDESADLQRAREAIASDRNVAGVQELLGARIVPESVRRAAEPPAKKPTTRK